MDIAARRLRNQLIAVSRAKFARESKSPHALDAIADALSRDSWMLSTACFDSRGVARDERMG